ncbi:MAG TPA: glycosyltransferase [Ktedonobacterales bacterium]|nr:glycosyltransferase [Ktedonobacterales bacterium]HEX5570674.1 glycosyltransferase [Ktedonobacterales bacterium]
MTMSTMRVSVVVPTYRRPALLERCLTALLAQRFEPSEYEIIVADDGASPEVVALMRRLAERARATSPGKVPALRYLPVTGTAHGPAAARNAGWRRATGAIIAFTDDDCIPAPGWLRAGAAALRAGADGASGKLVIPCRDNPTDYERNAALLAKAEFVTANCFYRRDALVSVNGFDERFPRAWREDSDLAFSLLERGARLVHAPAAVVAHPIRPSRWGVSLAQQRHSMYNALLYRKHPRLYRQRIQAAPPWRYYATVAALLMALVGAATWRKRLAATGIGVWGALTIGFWLTRLRGTSHAPAHLVEMLVTSALIPPLSVFWRLRGALRYRALFL